MDESKKQTPNRRKKCVGNGSVIRSGGETPRETDSSRSPRAAAPEPIRIPNFIIVGAARSGTTSLAEYLRGHPQIYMPKPYDANYFSTDFPRRTPLNAEQYRALFPTRDVGSASMIGEKSVTYLCSEFAPIGIREICGAETKIIIMLRDIKETERSLLRHWKYQGRRGSAFRLPVGCYIPTQLHIDRYYQLFRDVYIVDFDDFANYTEDLYRKVLEFLGVDPDYRPRKFRIYNRGRDRIVPFLKIPRPRFIKRGDRS